MAAVPDDDGFDQLETGEMFKPPPRSVIASGYTAPPELVTWTPFQYAQPDVRRREVREYMRGLPSMPELPPLRVVLMGGVASGKGTLAPMISQAFRTRVVGIGQLLRCEVRAGRQRGLDAAAAMAEGKLLDDDLVLSMLSERLSDSAYVVRDGWLLDGFPRTQRQAAAIVDGDWSSLRPDAVVVVARPTELVKEFCLGRCTDSTTGQTYHPVYAPPPEGIHSRLVRSSTRGLWAARVRPTWHTQPSMSQPRTRAACERSTAA